MVLELDKKHKGPDKRLVQREKCFDLLLVGIVNFGLRWGGSTAFESFTA